MIPKALNPPTREGSPKGQEANGDRKVRISRGIKLIVVTALFVAMLALSCKHRGSDHDLNDALNEVWYLLDDHYWKTGNFPDSYEAIRVKAESGLVPNGRGVPKGSIVTWKKLPPRATEDRPGVAEVEISISCLDGRSASDSFEFRYLDKHEYWRPHYVFNSRTRQEELEKSEINLANSLAYMIWRFIEEANRVPSHVQELSLVHGYVEFEKTNASKVVRFVGLEENDKGKWIVVEVFETQVKRKYPIDGPDSKRKPVSVRNAVK